MIVKDELVLQFRNKTDVHKTELGGLGGYYTRSKEEDSALPPGELVTEDSVGSF